VFKTSYWWYISYSEPGTCLCAALFDVNPSHRLSAGLLDPTPALRQGIALDLICATGTLMRRICFAPVTERTTTRYSELVQKGAIQRAPAKG
jgi:hypothetical protein